MSISAHSFPSQIFLYRLALISFSCPRGYNPLKHPWLLFILLSLVDPFLYLFNVWYFWALSLSLTLSLNFPSSIALFDPALHYSSQTWYILAVVHWLTTAQSQPVLILSDLFLISHVFRFLNPSLIICLFLDFRYFFKITLRTPIFDLMHDYCFPGVVWSHSPPLIHFSIIPSCISRAELQALQYEKETVRILAPP